MNQEDMMFDRYRRTPIAEMMPWDPEVDMTGVSISAPDREAGSPKEGDMIARNPANHNDKWLVSEAYFEANFNYIPIDEDDDDDPESDELEDFGCPFCYPGDLSIAFAERGPSFRTSDAKAHREACPVREVLQFNPVGYEEWREFLFLSLHPYALGNISPFELRSILADIVRIGRPILARYEQARETCEERRESAMAAAREKDAERNKSLGITDGGDEDE